MYSYPRKCTRTRTRMYMYCMRVASVSFARAFVVSRRVASRRLLLVLVIFSTRHRVHPFTALRSNSARCAFRSRISIENSALDQLVVCLLLAGIRSSYFRVERRTTRPVGCPVLPSCTVNRRPSWKWSTISSISSHSARALIFPVRALFSIIYRYTRNIRNSNTRTYPIIVLYSYTYVHTCMYV